jgi:hypothetical protein
VRHKVTMNMIVMTNKVVVLNKYSVNNRNVAVGSIKRKRKVKEKEERMNIHKAMNSFLSMTTIAGRYMRLLSMKRDDNVYRIIYIFKKL